MIFLITEADGTFHRLESNTFSISKDSNEIIIFSANNKYVVECSKNVIKDVLKVVKNQHSKIDNVVVNADVVFPHYYIDLFSELMDDDDDDDDDEDFDDFDFDEKNGSSENDDFDFDDEDEDDIDDDEFFKSLKSKASNAKKGESAEDDEDEDDDADYALPNKTPARKGSKIPDFDDDDEDDDDFEEEEAKKPSQTGKGKSSRSRKK